MHSEIDVLVDKFIDVVKEVVGDSQVKSVKQYHRDREKGYKTISCVSETEKYKIRFAYHVNEGAVFKKGIITLYFNIDSIEYHFSDILAHVAPRDKDLIVFPYVDNVETIKLCVELLWKKLNKYHEKIDELVSNEELKLKLERTLKKEIKIFSGKALPDKGPLALMLSGIYSNTSLIRYTSEPYEYFVNGNYAKALKLYNKEPNLALYEQQLVKFMKIAIKAKKKTEIPEEQKTINHARNLKKKTLIYSILSYLMLIPIMYIFSLMLFKLFIHVVNANAIHVIERSLIFLTISAVFLSVAFCNTIRDKIFKTKLEQLFKLQVLYNTDKYKKRKKIVLNSVVIASILTIALLAASSITLREDGIKYSKDILDFKGTIVPYNEIQNVDIQNSKIILENGEEILFDTFNCTINDIKLIKKIMENKQ